MFSTFPVGTRDTSAWRKGKFEDMFAHGSLNTSWKHITLQQVYGVDTLFGNEPARKAFGVFRKFQPCPVDEVTILTLIRLDAIITRDIDSFDIIVE